MDKNEELCRAAAQGDADALNALLENNLRFIRKIAYEQWDSHRESNKSLGIEIDDLAQEGALALLNCVPRFRPETGNKFLTYAGPAISNAMVDFIRSQLTPYKGTPPDSILRLDQLHGEEGDVTHEFIADSRIQNPEMIYLAKERHEELHGALQKVSKRDRIYLWYRYGFEDDMLHPLTETAEHFHLSENRARATEALALEHMRKELTTHCHSRRDKNTADTGAESHSSQLKAIDQPLSSGC